MTHNLSFIVLLKSWLVLKKLMWSTTRVWQFDSSYFRGFFSDVFMKIGFRTDVAILFVYTSSRGKINRNLFYFASLWRIFNSKKVNYTRIAFQPYNKCIILCIFGVDFPLFVCLIPPPGQLTTHFLSRYLGFIGF